MKIYIISFRECDYDQYDAFVVVARNRKEVKETVKRHTGFFPGEVDWEGGYRIGEIKKENYKRSKIILGSYHELF